MFINKQAQIFSALKMLIILFLEQMQFNIFINNKIKFVPKYELLQKLKFKYLELKIIEYPNLENYN